MSDNRPPIPADLRRRVLLEAGHRCAIPSCKYPKADMHHIVPWAKCLEHRFENLIALCPNCHRRAHISEIDRKSLLLYKVRLKALFGPELLISRETEGAARIWISSYTDEHSTDVFATSNAEDNFEVQIEYPKFHTDEEHELNKIIRRLIEKEAKDIITVAKDPERLSDLPYSLTGSFNIALHTPLATSLRFSFTSYSGGVHHNSYTKVINHRVDQRAVFGVEDLFAIPDFGIKKLSEYSIATLLGPTEFSRDKDQVEEGAGPDPHNFANFNLSTEGVLITFDEYQLGSYAEGRSEVLVPYTVLRPLASDFVEALITKCGGVDA